MKHLLTVLLMVGASFAQNVIPVTFQVDLRVKTAEELFIPGTDNVTVRGSFMDETGLRDGDWFPSEGAFVLDDAEGDTIYALTVELPDSLAGKVYEYKYQINDAVWEADPNRKFTLTAPETVIPVELFDRDSVVTTMVTNFLTFVVDLTPIYGTGQGFFDPDVNTLNLMGLDWVGATVVEELSDRKFVEDPFQPGIFTAVMAIEGAEGDSTKWKCKAEPESDFFNWGWEVTPDYWYTIRENDAEVELPIFTPNIFPVQPPLTEAVEVLFQVNMTNAHNFYTKDAIDPTSLEWIGIKGQNAELGAWAGDWMPADTTAGSIRVLNDSGKNGDKTAGDNIWSLLVTFPEGNDGGPGLYKYCAVYPGALEVNDGNKPLDNEMQGTDHWINVKVGENVEVYDDFGLLKPVSTGVEEKIAAPTTTQLVQNYPNPFNPVTEIQYELANVGMVTVEIYNAIGQKICTLVNEVQTAGRHSVVFDAAHMTTGVYFYKLTAGEFSAVKKMMLIK